MAWAVLAVNPKPLPLCPWKKCFLKSLCHLLSKEPGCPAGLCCIRSAWAPCFLLPETCHGRSWVGSLMLGLKKKKKFLERESTLPEPRPGSTEPGLSRLPEKQLRQM